MCDTIIFFYKNLENKSNYMYIFIFYTNFIFSNPKIGKRACEFRLAIIGGGVLIEHNFQPIGWKLWSINTPPPMIADMNSQVWESVLVVVLS